jgi:hypothetical protein
MVKVEKVTVRSIETLEPEVQGRPRAHELAP